MLIVLSSCEKEEINKYKPAERYTIKMKGSNNEIVKNIALASDSTSLWVLTAEADKQRKDTTITVNGKTFILK